MDFEKLNRAIGYDKLSLEEKLRRAVRAARLEMTPEWTQICRNLSGAETMEMANEMFVFARQEMYLQEIEKGFSEHEARLRAAQRMLNLNNLYALALGPGVVVAWP